MHGKFIVIDGIDHSGKGLQIDLLKKELPRLYYTREPGGTPLAEEIRTMLLRKDGPATTPLSDLFLFLAARASHVSDVVQHQRERGVHVICDRYDSSSFAFQIIAEQRPELGSMFWSIRDLLSPAYRPDAYIFFDLPAHVAYERGVRARHKEQSRFDAKPVEYHERVREAFRTFSEHLAVKEPSARTFIINADRTPEKVYGDFREIVRQLIT